MKRNATISAFKKVIFATSLFGALSFASVSSAYYQPRCANSALTALQVYHELYNGSADRKTYGSPVYKGFVGYQEIYGIEVWTHSMNNPFEPARSFVNTVAITAATCDINSAVIR